MGKAGGLRRLAIEAIGRLASLALRSGVQPRMIIKQLKGSPAISPPGRQRRREDPLPAPTPWSKAIEWYLENFDMFPGFPKPVAEAARPG